MFPEEIKKFVEIFEKLPSIGPRQAIRLAFKIISLGTANIQEISQVIADLKKIKICPRCFFVYSGEGNTCKICSDKNRVRDIFLIIEKETDLISIEKTKKYKGLYLVLGELTKSGFLESWQKMRLGVLKKIIEQELPQKKAKEIIIALNPTTYGDLNANLIKKEIESHTQKVSRLGRGIPTGGEIEFADEETIAHSLKRRE